MINEQHGLPVGVLTQACAQVGLDAAAARLIKFTNNAVFDLVTSPVVVRIPGSPSVNERVNKVVAVAKWLEENDMPSVRLVEGLPQPLEIANTRVTFWQRVPPANTSPTGYDLGRALRRYHTLPHPKLELPTWQPMISVRSRIESEDVLTPGDHAFLIEKCDEVQEALDGVPYFLPPGPVHGDAFMGNLIPGPEGPVLCDFDSTAYGPREWDLTPVAVGKLRFSYSTSAQEELASAYGTDILDWSHFDTLRQLRELQLVTSVLPVLRSNPKLVIQWTLRFKSFRDGDRDAIWTTYN
ncbi:phosphotransferase family protein [Salinispora arenicola]|uniref:phosphotransferase family protein n=1 Tax=Salinispora arenicola TaxID=168697 RepID=UPI0009B79383|nr:aminoglycoside phosphotransferase family protein [Salinispora arenicola]